MVAWQFFRRGNPIAKRSGHAITGKRIAPFVFASFLAQFFGNAAFQKALQHIGLAASVPITLGVLIVGGAILGAALLGEPVSGRKIVAMLTLILAVVILSLPREGPLATAAAPEAQPDAAETWNIVVGSLWASLSGLAYSFFGVTMRRTLQSGLASTHLMLISGVVGSVSLWLFCWATIGSAQIAETTPIQWLTMIAAGVGNFSAFVAITASLKSLPVVAVNLINASQVAMASVAGVLLFREPVTTELLVGIGLTFVGLVILARRTRAPIVITD